MPKDLPGLYWDETRNRYFPLSSRPKPPPPAPETISSKHRKDKALSNPKDSIKEKRHEPRERCLVPLHSNRSLLSTPCFTKRLRDTHEILLYHYASSSRMNHVSIPTLGYIHSFCSTQIGQRTWRLIGDSQGWLYGDKDFVPESRHGSHYWSADLNLQPSSPISSISVSGSLCVSTCLGPGKISVQNLTSPERMYLLNLKSVHDIRGSDLQGQRLVLGASKKAAYIPDIDVSTIPEYMHTKSDVFSVTQQESLIYTGTRNGAVERFDIRMPKHRGQKLFDTRFDTAPRSSVLHLGLVRDTELLLSHLNGDLVSFDLRYSSSTLKTSPMIVFDGHVNTNSQNLGITVDCEHDILFAAGEDNRIRAWSLRNGIRLIPPAPAESTFQNPLTADFPYPITCLQVTEESGEAGYSLWATSARELFQFHLGQRMTAIT